MSTRYPDKTDVPITMPAPTDGTPIEELITIQDVPDEGCCGVKPGGRCCGSKNENSTGDDI